MWYNLEHKVRMGVMSVEGIEFSGNFAHTIDPKGRVTIPAAYREALSGGFTIGLNNDFSAIALYPEEKWRDMSEKLDRIPDSDVRGMAYVRLVKAFSFTNQNLDSQGRVLLPQVLRQKAGMDKAIRFSGMGRYLEIWDEARFMATIGAAETDVAALLEYIDDRYFNPQN